MRKKRILHFITDMQVGGTELMLVRLLPHLKKTFDTRVVSVMPPGPVSQLLAREGIYVYNLNFKHWYDLRVIYRFWHVVRGFHPNILVTHLIHPDLFGRIFGRLFGIRTIVCSQQGSLLQWEYLRTVDYLTTFLVDHYIVQTPVAKAELSKRLQLPSDHFAVIPNSVVGTLPPADQRVLTDSHIPLGKLNIVCVSRLRRQKGHEYLLEAFEKIYAKQPNLNLILVGDGERERALQLQVQSYASAPAIFFLGRRFDVPQLLAVSDIFVLPTLAEGMSNAILEALAAGLAVVVSDIPANRALVSHEENGLLFTAGDSSDLAAKLTRLVNDEALRQRLGKRARQSVRDQFDPARIGDQWVKLLNSLV